MRRIISLIGLLGVLLSLDVAGASLAMADGNTNGGTSNSSQSQCHISGTDCTTTSRGAIAQTSFYAGLTSDACKVIPGCYDSVESDKGYATVPIHVWGICRYVDNISTGAGTSLFVPIRSAVEWQKFVQNAPANVISLANCSLPYSTTQWSVPVPPYNSSNCTDALSVNAPNLYARVGTIWPPTAEIVSFVTCHNSATQINASIQWLGMDSTLAQYAANSWRALVNYGPDLTLQASVTTVLANANTPVTLTWDASTVSSGYVDPGSGYVPNTPTGTATVAATWTSSTASTGTAVVSPASTTTYSMTANSPNNVTSIANVTVVVEQPISVTLTPSPNALNVGSSSTLTWSVANPISGIVCTASGGTAGDGWAGSALSVFGGSQAVLPSGTATYSLTCSDSLQSQTASTVVTVCPAGSRYVNGSCVALTYAWSDWSGCSASCGGGTQTRTCNGSDGSTYNDAALCGGGPSGQACNLQSCGGACDVTSTYGGSFLQWTNSANPFTGLCAWGCSNPNPATGSCSCPAGYIDGVDVNTNGSVGHEGCTGFTHTCVVACGGKFLLWTNSQNPFGRFCHDNNGIPGTGECTNPNPATGSCSCPNGYWDAYQTNTNGSVGHEGCTGFTHTCVPLAGSGACATQTVTDASGTYTLGAQANSQDTTRSPGGSLLTYTCSNGSWTPMLNCPATTVTVCDTYDPYGYCVASHPIALPDASVGASYTDSQGTGHTCGSDCNGTTGWDLSCTNNNGGSGGGG